MPELPPVMRIDFTIISDSFLRVRWRAERSSGAVHMISVRLDCDGFCIRAFNELGSVRFIKLKLWL